MKILIITCGVGIGHASRSLTLSKILKKHGHETIFASYNAGLHFIHKNNEEAYPIPAMNFQGEDGEIDIEKTVSKSKDIPFTFIKSLIEEYKIIKKTNPDIIITDSDYGAVFVSKILKKPCYIITNDLEFGFSNSTDKRYIKYLEKFIKKLILGISKLADAILIPDIPGSVDVPRKLEDKTHFIGSLIYHDETLTKDDLRRKYGVGVDAKVIVVTIGGSDFGKILIENMCDIAHTLDVDYIYMFTGFEINPDEFKCKVRSNNVIIKQFTYNLVEWMKLSDLTVALAGHTTTMELISIAKPNILIPLKNHIEQQKNIERIKPYNITQTLDINNKDQLKTTINETLKKLDTIKVDEKQHKEFMKYDGCQNTLKIIEENNI